MNQIKFKFLSLQRFSSLKQSFFAIKKTVLIYQLICQKQ